MKYPARMRPTSVIAVIAVMGTLAPASCTFEGGVPPNARVRCVQDDQCTSGDVCDVETQLCVPDGAQPPTVVLVEMPPAAGEGVVSLRIDANVALQGAPVLAWSPSDPGFVFDRVEGASAFLHLDVTGATPPDGFFTLASARLTSEAGIERTVPLASSLQIDRIAPSGALLVAHADFQQDKFEDLTGPFTERPGRAEAFVIVTVDEPILESELSVGIDGVSLLDGGCALDPAGFAVCGFTIAPDNAGSPIDIAPVEVTVSDVAGNARTLRRVAPFDFRAPAIEPGSVAVSLRTPSGQDGGTRVSPGETIELSFVVDEEVAAPTVTTDSPVPLTFELVSAVGRVFRYQLALDVDPLAELVTPLVTMSDPFGHQVSEAVIALPAPFDDDGSGNTGIPIADLEPSPCVFAPAPEGTATCVDLDDDGALGFQPGVCEPASPDCDDENPLRGPGFREVPTDGVANDCDALVLEDEPNDDEHVVYVDPVDGGFDDDPTGGTIDFPYATLAAGLAKARAEGKTLYLALGTYADIGATTLDVDVVGGLDPAAGWVVVGRSELDVNSTFTLVGDHAYAHLNLADVDGTTTAAGPATLFDVRVSGRLVIRAPCALVDVTAPRVEIEADASGTRIHGGSLASIVTVVEDVRVARATVGFLNLAQNTSAVVTNTLFTGGPSGPVIECTDCDLAAYHVSVRSGSSSSGFRIIGANARVRVVASVVDLTLPGAVLLEQATDDGRYAFADVVFDADVLRCGSAAVGCFDTSAASLAGMAGNGSNITDEEFPGAVLVSADPAIDPNDARRILDTSPARGLLGAFPHPGTPSTAAADFEGDCRVAPIDAGADSR